MMRRYIEVTKETRQKITQIFNVTERMVWKAISFDSNTNLAKKIRKYALGAGGIIMNELPECETIHDSNDYMRQYFTNGAVIEVNKNNGHVDIYFRGSLVLSSDNPTITQFKALQTKSLSYV